MPEEIGRLRRFRSDLLALLILIVLPLLWFAPVLFPPLTGTTLLPYDNLTAFAPWRAVQPDLVPHNELLSDLVLENAVWKLHIRRTLASGQLPLWNPQVFTGIPFLAAGQASVFYPLGILFYLLPLEIAYGWFTALQIALAGINFYLLGRVLRLRPPAALFAAVVYMFSGFLIVSVVFTMFIAAAAWLPLLLAMIEMILRKQEDKDLAKYSPIPYVIVGAASIGIMVLAGHPELIYYTLLVAALYALVRLLVTYRTIWQRTRHVANAGSILYTRMVTLAVWLLGMALLGIALGAVQLLPLAELLPLNFRSGSASYAQVIDWAWPTRHVLTFALPDIFGNPSHHRWFDLWRGVWTPATVNALGEPNQTIFWGIKNYVEGGSYLGIATWLLAGIALLRALLSGVKSFRSSSGLEHAALPTPGEIDSAGQPGRHLIRDWSIWFFAALALVSLLFAFGTPLYALLFYGLPGWNQLHSPFRWVFPFTVSMALLGGMGLQTLFDGYLRENLSLRRIVDAIALLALVVGLGSVGLVVASWLLPDPFIDSGQRIIDGSDLAQMAFADGRMFWGYQALNILRFGFFSLMGSALIWLFSRNKPARLQLLLFLPAFLIAADLWGTHGCFNPAADVALSPLNPSAVPPVVGFLNEREYGSPDPQAVLSNPDSLWRFTTFNAPGEKTFNANVGMYYGWQDIRGYDSVIPRQYVELMNRIAPQEGELLYNRIAPLYSNASAETYSILDNPILDLLNVKYVLTEHYIPNPKWQEVYRDESLGVYENRDVFPRAFIVPEARVVPAAEQPLLDTDLRQVVYLESEPSEENALVPASPQIADAWISRYTSNDLFVDVNLSDRGWLVLADAYAAGWKAFLRPFGSDESAEQEITIYQADGALRAVYLPNDGQWTVRFVYSPMSFKLGLYISFLAAMALLLLAFYWLWGKYYRPESTEGEVRTVAKNSLVPMTLSLTNKAIDFAFAMLYVRLLGPAGTGSYAFVVAIYGLFEIISRYGLGTLLTRDVAADKNQSSHYLTNVLALRTLLWLASLPLLALVVFGYYIIGQVDFIDASSIGRQEVQAIAIFAIAMIFANWADAYSSMFLAFEKMEYPAGLTNVMALLKVSLGALVLLLGWGFVGLAAVSLVVNIVQFIWLYLLLRITLFRPEWRWDWPLQKWMFRTSGPLMINHLLATVFWRIDIWILRPLAGAASVGLYSVALKYLDGFNIVPSVFTMAVFPLMSRYAKHDGENLRRTYVISLRLLVMVSLPVAMAITFLAVPLVWLVGGVQYLNVPLPINLLGRDFVIMGGSDLVLQIIIWSIPIGFVNSVTQYVLIAVNQQHFLTRAFIIGVVFNVTGNLLVIPTFGYVGAAVVTILSEFSLLFPFYYSVRRHVGTVPWLSVCAAPAASVATMGVATYLLMQLGINSLFSVLVGSVVYVLALAVAGAFRTEDMALVKRALPIGSLRRLTARRD